ncbi:MAG: hypothetical protein HY719_12610, partial [Planctomycetes bacterium]|nr:hypothetical protein [Planctomycetota bacterium]
MPRDVDQDYEGEGDDGQYEDYEDEQDLGPSLVEHCPECASKHTEFISFHPIGALAGGVVLAGAGYGLGTIWDAGGTGAVLAVAFGFPGGGVGMALASPRMVCTRCAHKWRTGWQRAKELLVFLPSFGAALGIVVILGLILVAIKLAGKLQTPDETILNTEIDQEEKEEYDPELKRDIQPIERPDETVPDPTEDPNIEPQAVDDHNEDPTDNPINNELAESDSNALN